ncbi:MAG TPA: cytochrome c oxidase assembly protein [Solirubrobacteraceae bacterium]|nr:cytochrome c oxidase assembly protein [Solirubrobacteraceae bacterium]
MRAPSLAQLLVGHWHPAWSLDAAAVVVGWLYLWAAHGVRGRWPAGRTLSFLAGTACVLVALQSGIDAYDDRLLSVHMVQHMLLLLLAPLLILGGRPVILALRTLHGEHRRTLARALTRLRGVTRPAVCLAVFAAVVLLTHLPAFFALTLRDGAVHAAEHLLFLVAGMLLWWPVLDGDPVPRERLGGMGRLVYVLLAMIPMAAVGAYLDRNSSLVYSGYAAPAHALGVSALADQAQAGAIMWVAGGTVMVAVGLWASMAALIEEERRQRARDAREARELREPLDAREARDPREAPGVAR